MPQMDDRRTLIENSIETLVGQFLYYDRKEYEELPLGEIEAAIKAGEITVEEIVGEFERHLCEGLPDDLVPPLGSGPREPHPKDLKLVPLDTLPQDQWHRELVYHPGGQDENGPDWSNFDVGRVAFWEPDRDFPDLTSVYFGFLLHYSPDNLWVPVEEES